MAADRSPALADIAGVADPLDGLRRITSYLALGEERMREARQLRAKFVLQAREGQHTWPAISEATGGVDQAYLRREMEDARRAGA